MLANILKQFLCLVVSLSSVSATAMKRPQERERAHCKLDLYNLIVNSLNAGTEPEALVWIDIDALFAINYQKFAEYYQKKGGSTATTKSIKNRLTKSKSGFFFTDEQQQARVPPGFDRIYTHTTWQRINTKIEATPQVQNVPPQLSKLELCLEELRQLYYNEGEAAKILFDLDPNIATTIWFNLHQFVLRLVESHQWPEYYEPILRILISNESGKILHQDESTAVPTDALKGFWARFAPYDLLLSNINNFISDGASNWYHGVLDEDTVMGILDRYQYDSSVHYLIYAQQLYQSYYNHTQTSLFKIGYKNEKIRHKNIYKNMLNQLYIVHEDGCVQYFDNFNELITHIVGEKATAIANDNFKALLPLNQDNVLDEFSNKLKSLPDITKPCSIENYTTFISNDPFLKLETIRVSMNGNISLYDLLQQMITIYKPYYDLDDTFLHNFRILLTDEKKTKNTKDDKISIQELYSLCKRFGADNYVVLPIMINKFISCDPRPWYHGYKYNNFDEAKEVFKEYTEKNKLYYFIRALPLDLSIEPTTPIFAFTYHVNRETYTIIKEYLIYALDDNLVAIKDDFQSKWKATNMKKLINAIIGKVKNEAIKNTELDLCIPLPKYVSPECQ